MMMKKIFLLTLGIFASFAIKAQSADEFLNSIVESYKSYDDISIVFNYKIINEEMGVNESSRGYGSIKGNSYMINVDGQELICDGKTLWTHLIEDEEVMISEVTDDNDASPIAILNSLSNNISTKLLSISPNITIEVVENEQSTFEKLHINVDSNLRLKDIHIFLGDGNELIYEITELTTNQNLPDSMFIFDEAIHPNVEVIDMR
ncbi:MAG: outer membrane lipoprotein carrier protein LolA [Lentimicrobiaceae bacterium]|nr:outer membrane lipoprotein carrier protein LolA [Lentimicrobiaceae bacterium]